ncbi:barstar family protein [Rhodococcoides fascians]|uniref:barstar family protein n=1 Tax=Rhodococcoides fascians TaxID=1828 RepID=UPI0012D349C9|nr:barstar family protein [Rhodococcus fascians]
MTELERTNGTRYEWIEGDWKYNIFSSTYLSYKDLGHIKVSMRAIPLETSSRSVTFDPIDGELFTLQRQQFDWRLLQNGFVHTCRDRFTLDTATGHLAELDYLIHSFDAGVWHDIADMHTAFAQTMSFPAYYCRNLDALNDVLSDVGRYSYGSDPHRAGTVLTITGFDSLLELDRRTALLVLDIFARQARLATLYGHAMLCLIETSGRDFDRVGGMVVSGVSVSELPPDLPRPFDESVVMVFSYDIYATPAEAEHVALDLQTPPSGRQVARGPISGPRFLWSDEPISWATDRAGHNERMGFELCSDASAGKWLNDQRLDWSALAARGPIGYAAYARVRFIPDPAFPGQRTGGIEFEQKELSEKGQVGVAIDIVSRYTTTPDECYFCMWDGWVSITVGAAPNFKIPNRDYFLFRGTVADYADWNSNDPARWQFGDSPDPAFIWPADRTWCVTNDVDPHFATIGAPAAAIDEIVADNRIDAVLDDRTVEPPHWFD